MPATPRRKSPFQFRFKNTRKDLALDISATPVAIPLISARPVPRGLNVTGTYTVDVVRGNRRTGTKQAIANAKGSIAVFAKRVDKIARTPLADYAVYAANFVTTSTSRLRHAGLAAV